MTDLAIRSRRAEQMDAADLDADTYACVLRDLSRVNRWTMATWPTIRFLEQVIPKHAAFNLLDVGFGHGDTLRTIARWARRTGRTANLVGIDLNAKSAAVAREATPADTRIDYRAGDYRDLGDFDVICSSLVAHHMSDEELQDFLTFMEGHARRGWIVNDLHRHGFAYHGYPLLARLLGVHRIVREDGRLSIARAFRPSDWTAILHRAGLQDDTAVHRHFPFRLCVERMR